MKEKMLDQFDFSEKVKEEIIRLVFYQRQSAKVVAQKYDLPNIHLTSQPGQDLQKEARKGRYNFASHAKAKTQSDTTALKKTIQQVEKSLEKANVLIYGLNFMIDYAEKELKVPIPKKPGTKQRDAD